MTTTMPLSALFFTLLGLAPCHTPGPAPDVIPVGMRGVDVDRSVDLSELHKRCCVSYVVRKGDSLAQIATRELGSTKRLPELLELNPDLEADSMRVGARIWLPALDPSAPRQFLYLAHWGPSEDLTPFAAPDGYPTYWAIQWGFVVVDEAHQAELLERTAAERGRRGRANVHKTVREMVEAKQLQFVSVETTSALVETSSSIARKVERIRLLCDDKGHLSTKREIRSLDKQGRELKDGKAAGAFRGQSWLLLVGLLAAGWLVLRGRRHAASVAVTPAT